MKSLDRLGQHLLVRAPVDLAAVRGLELGVGLIGEARCSRGSSARRTRYGLSSACGSVGSQSFARSAVFGFGSGSGRSGGGGAVSSCFS